MYPESFLLIPILVDSGHNKCFYLNLRTNVSTKEFFWETNGKPQTWNWKRRNDDLRTKRIVSFGGPKTVSNVPTRSRNFLSTSINKPQQQQLKTRRQCWWLLCQASCTHSSQCDLTPALAVMTCCSEGSGRMMWGVFLCWSMWLKLGLEIKLANTHFWFLSHLWCSCVDVLIQGTKLFLWSEEAKTPVWVLNYHEQAWKTTQ